MKTQRLARRLPLLLLAVALLPAGTDEPREDLVRVVEELDAGFVCPQFLESDRAREDEAEKFALALAEIGVTYDYAVEIRRALLTRHHCLRQGRSGA